MKTELINELNAFYEKFPAVKGEKSSREEVEQLEKSLDMKFDDTYVEFLLNWGGSMVRSSEIYGIRNCEFMEGETVKELNSSYRKADDGISKNWLIIGTDFSGNPIYIDEKGGVMVKDYDFGTTTSLAQSFEEYLEKSLNDEF